jgi:hypothetical protein
MTRRLTLVASLVAATAVAAVGVAAATKLFTSTPPSGMLGTITVHDPGTRAPTRYLIWRSDDGTLLAAAPAKDPAHYVELVRGERLDAAYGGEDFAYTYHSSAAVTRRLEKQLVGMTPELVDRVLPTGRWVRQPGWVAPALRASGHPDQLVDDWGSDAQGFARAHPGAWWAGAVIFGHKLQNLQSWSGTRLWVPTPYVVANYKKWVWLSVSTDDAPLQYPYDSHRLVVGGRTYNCGFDQEGDPHHTICNARIGDATVEVWGPRVASSSWWRGMLPHLQPMPAGR